MRIHLSQTDSTNRVAREEALAGAASGTVVWADRQIAGKGQYGRSFVSPVGGLYFSLILRPVLPPQQLPLITLATGLACREVLSRRYKVEAQLKWPNDLFVHGKKVGGILCETFLTNQDAMAQANVIIGVGINCTATEADFPEELRPLVTTLAAWSPNPIDIAMLLEQLVAEIEGTIEHLQGDSGSLLDRWQNHDYLFGQLLRFSNGNESFIATGRGIGHDGCYRLLDDQGREHRIIGGQLRPLGWPEA